MQDRPKKSKSERMPRRPYSAPKVLEEEVFEQKVLMQCTKFPNSNCEDEVGPTSS